MLDLVPPVALRQARTESLGVNPRSGPDDVVTADDRQPTAVTEIEAAIGTREVGGVERHHDHATKAPVVSAEPAGELHRPLARSPANDRFTDEKLILRRFQMHTVMLAIAEIDRLSG